MRKEEIDERDLYDLIQRWIDAGAPIMEIAGALAWAQKMLFDSHARILQEGGAVYVAED